MAENSASLAHKKRMESRLKELLDENSSLEEQLERSESQGDGFVFGLEIQSGGEHRRAPVGQAEDSSSASDDEFESEAIIVKLKTVIKEKDLLRRERDQAQVNNPRTPCSNRVVVQRQPAHCF